MFKQRLFQTPLSTNPSAHCSQAMAPLWGKIDTIAALVFSPHTCASLHPSMPAS